MMEIGAKFLADLSDCDLIVETKAAIKVEREATAVVVRYFREIHDRELFLKYACSSLFEFATEKLGYCAASAQARINAMRLIQAVPQVEEKIESGELSLTAAARVQTFFQAERKENKTYSISQKLEVINECLSKSTREVERELASRNPELAKIESIRPVGRDRFQVSFSISEEAEAKMKRLKGLFSHSNPNMTTEELLQKLLELGLDKFDPIRKAQRSNRMAEKKASFRAHDVVLDTIEANFIAEDSSKSSHLRNSTIDRSNSDMTSQKTSLFKSQVCAGQTSSFPKRSRYIRAETKHKVWLRNAGAGCEHLNSNGERCGDIHALQLDHIHGFARGGSHDEDNLRIVCARHNRHSWREAIKRV